MSQSTTADDDEAPTVETDAIVVNLTRRHLRDLVRDQHVAVFTHEGGRGVAHQGENPFAYLYLNGGEHSGSDYKQLISEAETRHRDKEDRDSSRPVARFNVSLSALTRLMNGETIEWGHQGDTALYVIGTDVE